MKELQKIANDKIQSMVDDGTIQKVVETSIEKAIIKAIDGQFDSWGNITKQIKEAMDKGLQVDTSDLPFDTYNQQMLVLLKTRLGDMFQGAAAEKFLSEMDDMLSPAPKEMPINEFVETIVGFWKTEEPWDADDLDEYATVEVESEGRSGDTVSLKIWKQKEYNSYLSTPKQNDPNLHLFVLNGVIRISHKYRYNPTCFSETEAFVFKLYSAGTILTGIEDFEPEDCDLLLKDMDY